MGKKKHQGRKWTATEEEYLAQNYGTAPMWKMMRDLKRTASSIITHACRINPDRRKYANYDIDGIFDRVKELFDAGMNDRQIVERMPDTFGKPDDVCQYRRRHGLVKTIGQCAKPWTMQEEIFLRGSWEEKSLTELATILGRSEDAVKSKIRAMGLKEGGDE